MTTNHKSSRTSGWRSDPQLLRNYLAEFGTHVCDRRYAAMPERGNTERRLGSAAHGAAPLLGISGAILAGADVLAESVQTKDQYKYQRVYRQPFMYAPVTGWYTFGNETGVERSQNSFLSGEDDRLFVNRLVDLVELVGVDL